MVDIIKKIDKIDSVIYYELIKKYGRDSVNKAIDAVINDLIKDKKLSYEFSKNLWDKYGYYLAVSDNCYNNKFVNNNNNIFWNEKGYGLDLLKRDYIKIFSSSDVNLDLDMVFGSIKSSECRDYVINKFNYLLENCGRISNFDVYLKNYMNEYINGKMNYSNNNILSEEELMDNVDMYVKYSIARNAFMVSNINLVSDIANSYNFTCVSYDDMYMEGFMGLVRCIQKFDVRRENKFYTYAYYYVYRYIFRAVYRKNNIVKIPAYVLEERNKINNAFWYLFDINKKKPSDVDIANYLKVDVKKIIGLKEIFRAFDFDSLDRAIADDGAFCLGDVISDNGNNIDKLISDNSFDELMDAIKNVLTDKEFNIIIERIVNDKTLNEIGKYYNCSGENIRQIESRALKKIRNIENIGMFSDI